MVSKSMEKLLNNNSVIRAMFEEGKRLKKIYGDDNVYDFSLGNPSVEAPIEINDRIINVVNNTPSLELHGYMSNAGFDDVREAIANDINIRFEESFLKENIIMCVGAASGLNIIFRTILDQDDEVITVAPYFSEYNNYIQNFGGKVVAVDADKENFYPDIKKIEEVINVKTKAVLLNNPNNPTGVIYPEEVIIELADMLKRKAEEVGHEIYLISDEPYRELVYDGVKVPFMTKYYDNTFVVYSYSKSLSLPGERIGYVLVSNRMNDYEKVTEGVVIANRILGSVNAPALMQKVIMNCLDLKTNIKEYEENRNELISIIEEVGFEYVKPQGAFYLFVKAPIEDDKEFCNIAKKYNLLFVPASSFSCKGYVRIAYCVDRAMIKRSRNAFVSLANEIKR